MKPKCFLLACLLCIVVVPLWRQALSQGARVTRSNSDAANRTPAPKVLYRDIAAQAGLTARHVSGSAIDRKYILESTGSGVGLVDFDRDGFLDIFLGNGTTLETPAPGQEPTQHLYRNNRDGTFKDVTLEANLFRSGWGQGVCAGDFDNDGDDDLFVTFYGQNVLYRNAGNGRFEDITQKAGLLHPSARYSTGCSFLDFDRDGNLDLFVANYVQFDFKETPAKGATQNCNWRGMPVFCGPKGLRAGINWLYRNNGDGTFSDVSEKSGISKPRLNYGLASIVSDFDHDGWPDIYVACDSSANIFFRNQQDGTFADLAIVSGTAFNDDGMEQAGMGVSVGDYDHDGLFDLVKTNFADDTSTLYHNSGNGSFTDATFRAGLGMNTRFLGWGTCFLDFDHDGWKDLFMANGHVYPEVDARKLSVPYRQERVLYWNRHNGTFVDISAQAGPGILSRWSSRGAAIGDLDNDGSLEIVVNNMHDAPSLLKNDGEKKNWLIVQLLGHRSNRNGIGARVTVQAGDLRQADEIRSGGSYVSQNDLRLHFGLGDALLAERIYVEWPSGETEVFQDLKANQRAVLEEGKGKKATRPD
jgi:hypothetical protein